MSIYVFLWKLRGFLVEFEARNVDFPISLALSQLGGLDPHTSSLSGLWGADQKKSREALG